MPPQGSQYICKGSSKLENIEPAHLTIPTRPACTTGNLHLQKLPQVLHCFHGKFQLMKLKPVAGPLLNPW